MVRKLSPTEDALNFRNNEAVMMTPHTKSEVRAELEGAFYKLSHSCVDAQMYFEDNEVGKDYPNHDGCLIVKCWNCAAEDHYLYVED